MPRLRSTLLATLTTLAFTCPAMADTIFKCADGSSVTLYDVAREMRINGVADGFSIALPLGHMFADSGLWTTRVVFEEAGHECTPEIAPCVQYDFPSGGPDSLTYQLSEASPVVRCKPEGQRLGSLY